MTDRELVELAAMASGIEGTWQNGWFPGLVGSEVGDIDVPWNPLKNDGQALRLAVKLRLSVCCPTAYDDCALAGNGNFIAYSEDELGDQLMITDNYVATRRAIVRAAAMIGKTL